MGSALARVLTAGLCLLGLSGCVFGSVDELYALPRSSQTYLNLQQKINAERGSAEYITPLSGENRQAIQLVDLDGDGRQEAVTFFRDASAETPLQIEIFRQDQRGGYQPDVRIGGLGSEIESIEYLNLDDGAGLDILVSWQASASIHTLVGYSIERGQAVEIFRSGYGQYLAADLDEDGREEIILSRAESSGSARWRIEYYDGQSGTLELTSTALLSEGAADISSWTSGNLEGGTPALFVSSYLDRDLLVTDVFCADRDGLKNISLDPATRCSPDTFRYYAGVYPEDWNGDGLTEVPSSEPVPAYGESTVDQFWWLNWMHYLPDGSSTQVMTTYQSTDGSWYLELPAQWSGSFAMNRAESAAEGLRSVTFARQIRGGAVTEPFLTIRCLVGGDRAEQARQAGQFILYADSTTVYTGQLLDSSWDCGLTQQDVIDRFHAGSIVWDREGSQA